MYLAAGKPRNALPHDQIQSVSHQLCKYLQHHGYSCNITINAHFMKENKASYTYPDTVLRKPGGRTICPPQQMIGSKMKAATYIVVLQMVVCQPSKQLYHKCNVKSTNILSSHDYGSHL